MAILKFTIEGQPKPKPRMTRKSWFMYKKYWDYINLQVKEILKRNRSEKIKMRTNDITCLIIFKRKTKRRADIDNLIKTVLEIFEKAKIIKNDNQVIGITAKVEYDVEEPRTYVEIYDSH